MSSDDVNAPLLSVRGLSTSFTTRRAGVTRVIHAVRSVSFDVQEAEVVALVGESGSGKTTIARLIARLARPRDGEIWFRGQNVLVREPRTPSLRFRSQVQLVFQDPFAALNPAHTVGYHLARPLRRHRKVASKAEATARTHELLEAVGLRPANEIARQHPHELSGGQRQRVSIARALAVDPALMLADEPVSMLDVSIRGDILKLLADLREKRRIGCLYITHDLGSARALADRALVLFAGEVVESGPIADLVDAPAHPYTALLMASVPDARQPGSFRRPLPRAPADGLERTSTAELGSGCPFRNRCPRADERCVEETPALRPHSSQRQVRCHWPLGPGETP